MTGVDDIGRKVQSAYAGAPKRERLHVAGRLRSCPVDAIAAATPSRGRILDFGCGHGAVALYLALSGAERQITGVDVDGDKLRVAIGAAAAVGARVTFEQAEVGYRPAGEWDAITIIDVLYLLGESAALEVLDAAAGALVPGGVLLVKELDVRPRRKFWFAAVQEFVATKVLRITEGKHLHYLSPKEMEARLASHGLAVEHRSLHAGRLHPHHLIVARRAAVTAPV